MNNCVIFKIVPRFGNEFSCTGYKAKKPAMYYAYTLMFIGSICAVVRFLWVLVWKWWESIEKKRRFIP